MKYLILILLIIAVISLGVAQQIEIYDLNKDIDRLETFSMYDKEIKDTTKLNGVYHSTGYMCLWTADRNFTSIMKTFDHEVCHELIHKDNNKHFCKQ